MDPDKVVALRVSPNLALKKTCNSLLVPAISAVNSLKIRVMSLKDPLNPGSLC